MIFSSFATLESMGIDRPSFALEGALYWSKLYPQNYENQTHRGFFTTIRADRYTVGQVIPVYLDKKEKKWKLFDAKVLDVKPIKKIDIDDRLAKNDADMTREELYRFLDVLYKRKHGRDPQLYKISLQVVGA
jgi:hypothetical protein